MKNRYRRSIIALTEAFVKKYAKYIFGIAKAPVFRGFFDRLMIL